LKGGEKELYVGNAKLLQCCIFFQTSTYGDGSDKKIMWKKDV